MPVLFFSPPLPSSPLALSAKTQIPQKRLLASLPRKTLSVFVIRASDNETGAVIPVAVDEVPKKVMAPVPVAVEEVPKKEDASVPAAVEEKPVEEEKKLGALQSNGAALKVEASVEAPGFKDPRWVAGTWDLVLFKKNGTTDWDAVIDAETRRRKWLEGNPEASSNTDPVIFDTSIIPWWAWMKRFHLPEAELLNGRAAMVGFFMAYFVDALTGVGLVDQMGNFFCKTLLLVAVAGVLLIRKNEDIDNLKKLIEETTFYDKQWKATWQDEDSSNSSTK